MDTVHRIESEGALRELLFHRTMELDRSITLACPDPALKWRYVSAMQKCIRRGHVEAAMIAADSILSIDPYYLWQRLRIVAFEDIGLGDPVATALTCEAVRSLSLRHRLGERRVLFAVVAGLANATKDRTLTDLHCLDPTPPLTAHQWSEHVESLNLPWLIQYLAVHGKAADNLGLEVPRLWGMLPSHTEVVRSAPDEFGDQIIGGVIAASYDKHVAEGKRAMAYFRKACTPIREYFSRNPDLDPQRALAIVLFYAEAIHLDRYSDWPGRQELSSRSHMHVCLSNYGFQTEAQVQELRAIAAANRELLNRCRRRIVGD